MTPDLKGWVFPQMEIETCYSRVSSRSGSGSDNDNDSGDDGSF